MHAIKTVDLFKQYKKLTAADNLNLEVQREELFSLLGVNGAGKTTTIKMLSGLIRPTAGDAFISGYSIIQTPEQAKRRIGVSPQDFESFRKRKPRIDMRYPRFYQRKNRHKNQRAVCKI